MEMQLPPSYSLERDADIVLLRRGAQTIAAFSARGVTRRAIEAAAWADHGPSTLRDRRDDRPAGWRGRLRVAPRSR